MFFDKGLLVTVNTDNMSVSNTTLKREYRRLMEEFGFTPEEMKILALNSVKAAFVGEIQKAAFAKKIEESLASWLEA